MSVKYPLYADAWRDDVPVDELRLEIQAIYELLGVSAPAPLFNPWDFGTFAKPTPATADFGTFTTPALSVDFGEL